MFSLVDGLLTAIQRSPFYVLSQYSLAASQVRIKDRIMDDRVVDFDKYLLEVVSDKEMPLLAIADAAGTWAR